MNFAHAIGSARNTPAFENDGNRRNPSDHSNVFAKGIITSACQKIDIYLNPKNKWRKIAFPCQVVYTGTSSPIRPLSAIFARNQLRQTETAARRSHGSRIKLVNPAMTFQRYSLVSSICIARGDPREALLAVGGAILPGTNPRGTSGDGAVADPGDCPQTGSWL